MADLVTAQKRTLENVALSRGILPTGSRNEILGALNQFSTPFGIDPSLPQHEKVIQMVEVSSYQIAKYLMVPQKDVMQKKITRRELLERLFNESLNEISLKVLEYSQLPLARLKKLSGEDTMIRTNMIRKLLIPKKGTELVNDIANTLASLNFEVIEPVPSAKPIKNLEKAPFSIKTAKVAISQSKDPSEFYDELLEELVEEYIIFPRKIKRDESVEIMKDVIRYPVLPAWFNIRKFLKGKKLDTLQELASFYGYSGLDKKQIEFFFSRGYVPGIEREKQLSDELNNILIELYGDRVSVQDDTDTHQQWIQTFISWDGLSVNELLPLAEEKGISINPYLPKSYLNDIPLYLDVDKYVIDLENPPRLEIEDLAHYSDRALIDFFPQAPYGRENLINSFIDYWEDERYFYYDGKFYKGVLDSYEEIIEGIDYNTLSISELIDLSFWVNDNQEIRQAILDEIKNAIIDAQIEGIPDSLPEDIEELLYTVRRMTIAGFGGNGAVPLEPGLMDEITYDIEFENYSRILNEMETKDVLYTLPMFDFKTLTLSKRTLGSAIEKAIEYKFFDTVSLYLILFYEKLDDIPTMARRP